MATRKHRKARKLTKRFRRTRSKRQRGGGPKSKKRKTPPKKDNEEIIWAAEEGELQKVKDLLEDNVNVNTKSKDDKETALHVAVYTGNVEMVELLLNNGANIKLRAVDNSAAYDIVNDVLNDKSESSAPTDNYNEIKVLLMEHPDFNSSDYGKSDDDDESESEGSIRIRNGETALHAASREGHTKTVAKLLKEGADVNATDYGVESGRRRDYDGKTALINASEEGHTEIVRMLLAARAKVNMRGSWGSTALLGASFDGSTEIVRMLLDAGADVNEKDEADHTPLWAAVSEACRTDIKQDNRETIELLLEEGADVNVEDSPEEYWASNHTVLGLAAENGNLEVLKLLLEKGTNVDVNMPNKFDRTPLWLASANGHIDVVRELVKAGATIPPSHKEQIEEQIEQLEREEREERRDALTGVAIRLTNTTPTTNKEYVIKQVLGQTVSNPDGKIIGRPFIKEISGYVGGKRKTRKSKKSKKSKRKTRK